LAIELTQYLLDWIFTQIQIMIMMHLWCHPRLILHANSFH